MIKTKPNAMQITGPMEIFVDETFGGDAAFVVTIGNHDSVGLEIARWLQAGERGKHVLVGGTDQEWTLTLTKK